MIAIGQVTPPTCVLIVDDEPLVRGIYRLWLERAGHRVLEAGDGLAGLDAVSSARPDLIFCDVRMPNLDGIEMLRRLMADPATWAIPVVMLTNQDEPALVKESLRLGAKEYLVKVNTDPRQLATLVSRLTRLTALR